MGWENTPDYRNGHNGYTGSGPAWAAGVAKRDAEARERQRQFNELTRPIKSYHVPVWERPAPRTAARKPLPAKAPMSEQDKEGAVAGIIMLLVGGIIAAIIWAFLWANHAMADLLAQAGIPLLFGRQAAAVLEFAAPLAVAHLLLKPRHLVLVYAPVSTAALVYFVWWRGV